MKKVVSASRRIDLLACFPERLASHLDELGPENIHTLVLWTKDPRPALTVPPLRRILGQLDSIFLHLTVTGLGGTEVEPGVPPWDEALKALSDLYQLPGLRPEGVSLRYDPLMAFETDGGGSMGNMEESLFRVIAERASALGIGSLRTSLISPYTRALHRLAAAGLRIAPGVIGHGMEFLDEVMEPVCRHLGIPLYTCVNPDRADQGCIDGDHLMRIHPQNLRCSRARDRSQRPGCRCTRAIDIGRYYSCPHGCLYCYGNPSFPGT